jgi:hypothetical protein
VQPQSEKRNVKTRKRRILSPQQVQILRLFLDETDPDYPSRRLFGAQVVSLTGLPSSRVYPGLDKLRSRGILESEPEPYVYGQSGRRVFYALCDLDAGRAALDEYLEYHHRAGRQTSKRPRLRGSVSNGLKPADSI